MTQDEKEKPDQPGERKSVELKPATSETLPQQTTRTGTQLMTSRQLISPWYVSTRTFTIIWLLLGLLLLLGFWGLYTPVPRYASGTGIVVDWRNNPTHSINDMVILLILPAEYLPRLHPGQSALVKLGPTGHRLSEPIVSVESEIISPEAAREKFALSDAAAQRVTSPSAIAFTRLNSLATGADASVYTGSLLNVDVEVGSQRLGQFLPLIGKLFGE